MIFIAHRGNLHGKNVAENSPKYIENALNAGFDVEIDVRLINNRLWTGHDEAQYEVPLEFVQNDRLWVHCKNLEAIWYLIDKNVHCFYHESDACTLTSRKIIWAMIGHRISPNSVCVLPELASYTQDELSKCYGICSDKVAEYKDVISRDFYI